MLRLQLWGWNCANPRPAFSQQKPIILMGSLGRGAWSHTRKSYLCRPEFLFQGKFVPDTHLNTAHRREPGTCRHRGRSHPPRGHCTPDSLHGREHSGACLRRSGWDRTGGMHPYTGRTRACTLGWGKQQRGIYLFCSGLAHPLPL